MNQWDEIEIKDLEGDMIDVAENIGLSAAKKLLTVFGGESIYFPKPESVIRAGRDRKIYEEFNGFNYRPLAYKYKLTTRQIRAIIKEQRRQSSKGRFQEQELFKEAK
jgi:Mor family transcriptional regulator